jgi:hypothetical protein
MALGFSTKFIGADGLRTCTVGSEGVWGSDVIVGEFRGDLLFCSYFFFEQLLTNAGYLVLFDNCLSHPIC